MDSLSFWNLRAVLHKSIEKDSLPTEFLTGIIIGISIRSRSENPQRPEHLLYKKEYNSEQENHRTPNT